MLFPPIKSYNYLMINQRQWRLKFKNIFSFPHPVNEKASRVVAAGVIILALAAILSQEPLLWIALTLGFWLRVLSGPSLSPLGQLATRVIGPRLGAPKYCPGPPKRFAQLLGALLTTTALALYLGGATSLATGLLIALIILASLEAVCSICLGCRIFAVLIRYRLAPDHVCQSCQDIWSRPLR